MIELHWLVKKDELLTRGVQIEKVLQYRTGTLFKESENAKGTQFDAGDVIIWNEWEDVPEAIDG